MCSEFKRQAALKKRFSDLSALISCCSHSGLFYQVQLKLYIDCNLLVSHFQSTQFIILTLFFVIVSLGFCYANKRKIFDYIAISVIFMNKCCFRKLLKWKCTKTCTISQALCLTTKDRISWSIISSSFNWIIKPRFEDYTLLIRASNVHLICPLPLFCTSIFHFSFIYLHICLSEKQ